MLKVGGIKMTKKQVKEVYDYIMSHVPQATVNDTIDVAIRAVIGDCSLATLGDLLNRDDACILSHEEREKFAGIKGRGWAQSLDNETISLLQEAAQYTMRNISDSKKDKPLEYIQELKHLKNNLINKVLSDNNNLGQYSSDNNINKTVK